VACSNDPISENIKIIQELEDEVKSTSNGELAKKLLDEYYRFIITYSNDSINNPVFLFRSAELSYILNDFQGSIRKIKRLIKDYPNHNYETAANLLGNIFREKLQSEDLAQIVFQSLLKNYPNNKDAQSKAEISEVSLDQRISEIQNRIFDLNSGKIDFSNAGEYIEACDLYALLNPSDSLSPLLLYRSSETYRAIRNFNLAIELYDRVMAEYPSFSKNEQILFLKAFTLDNDLDDQEKAKVAYEQFLNKYPTSDFADDAKFLLDNLGKEEDEIIKGLTN
jgi:TolA-binding protein